MTPEELIHNASVRETYHDAKLLSKENVEGTYYHFSSCLTSLVIVKESSVIVSGGNNNNWKQNLLQLGCRIFIRLDRC